MIVSANERRQILKLYNVTEAARLLRLDAQLMHRLIRNGRMAGPTLMVGRRRYYSADDLKELKKTKAASDM